MSSVFGNKKFQSVFSERQKNKPETSLQKVFGMFKPSTDSINQPAADTPLSEAAPAAAAPVATSKPTRKKKTQNKPTILGS